jgi:tRNA 2-thiouridine synthesizing protein A
VNLASDSNPIEVDARGLRCPLPVIRLAEAARDAPPGTRIVVLASDPAARHDIPAWCRMRGHELAEISEFPQIAEMFENTDSPKAPAMDSSPAGGQHQPNLRFVVLLRAQRSNADGIGSDSEPSSRAR